MTKFSENISTIIKEITKSLIILIGFIIIIWLYVYSTTNYVIVRFNELGPLTRNMPAYYNGFRIGKIIRIEPDKGFKNTLARVNLIRKNINLPQNTTVNVERFPNGEFYLQFVYPQSPSLNKIKRGEVLEGIAQSGREQFMLGQSVSGMTDVVSEHIVKALNSADAANQEIKTFFRIVSDLVEENNKTIKISVNNTRATTKSLAQMAENLNQAAQKINNALDEKALKDTTSNIKDTTYNLIKATEDIDKTIKKIDDTMCHVNATAQNLNSITTGLNETLSRKFAGIRLMFGTPVKQTCVKNACN
ncbi:MAG: hypothetical protein PHC64_01520 [Candidatus Gastranaerophilales bacterium]|nr:hypothetical protein [Candidatus Gastranaerophilales bacterium]